MSISSNASSGGCAGCRKCRSRPSSSRSSSPSSLRSYSLNQLRKRGRRFASRTVARSPGAAKGLRAAKGLSGTTLTSQTHPSIFACSCAVFASRLEHSFCCLRCEACLSRESGGKDSGSRTHAQGPMANGSGAPAAEANYLHRSVHSSFGSLELLDAWMPKLRCVPTMAARGARACPCGHQRDRGKTASHSARLRLPDTTLSSLRYEVAASVRNIHLSTFLPT